MALVLSVERYMDRLCSKYFFDAVAGYAVVNCMVASMLADDCMRSWAMRNLLNCACFDTIAGY